MKISSLADLRELLQLLVEQDIELFELDGLKIARKSKLARMVVPLVDASEYSEPNSEASEASPEDEELLYYSSRDN